MNPGHVVGARALTSTPLEPHSSANGQASSQERIVRQHLAAASLCTPGDPARHSVENAQPQPTRPLAIREIAINDPNLRINYVPEACRTPLEGLPEADPRWQRELQAALIPDNWWKKDGQSPASVGIYEGWVQERRRAEENREEFRFLPLMVTLKNMQTFVAHILANRQFPAPLTDKETRAMAWVYEKSGELLKDGAPYKRTVHLAFALMMLCEIVTDRQVLRPLQRKKPELFKWHVSQSRNWSGQLKPDGCLKAGHFSAAALDPEWVARLCWGGNNAEGEDEKVKLLAENDYQLRYALESVLDVPWILLVPSFETLKIDDFCRFSHLPVYPVGMSTAYLLNADGIMRSPLVFAVHDLGHMKELAVVGEPEEKAETHQRGCVLASYVKRLAWRCLLLDQTPTHLGLQEPDPAWVLLMFRLLHENSPAECRVSMRDFASGFLFLLEELAHARRQARNGYEKIYRDITDAQAVTAAFWAMRLWLCWQAAGEGPVTQEQLHACVESFLKKDISLLQEHLDFFDRHRGVLRHLFVELCEPSAVNGDNVLVCLNDAFVGQEGMILFSTYHEASGLHNFDNTDLAYFSALTSPQLRQKMADRIGVSVPDVSLLGLDDATPESGAMDAGLLLGLEDLMPEPEAMDTDPMPV